MGYQWMPAVAGNWDTVTSGGREVRRKRSVRYREDVVRGRVKPAVEVLVKHYRYDCRIGFAETETRKGLQISYVNFWQAWPIFDIS